MSNEAKYKEMVKEYATAMAYGKVRMSMVQYITQDFVKLGFYLNIPFYPIYNISLENALEDKRISRWRKRNGIPEEKQPAAIKKEEKKEVDKKLIELLKFIQNKEPIHIDTIADKLGYSINDLNVNLLQYEFDGYVKRLPGKRYAIELKGEKLLEQNKYNDKKPNGKGQGKQEKPSSSHETKPNKAHSEEKKEVDKLKPEIEMFTPKQEPEKSEVDIPYDEIKTYIIDVIEMIDDLYDGKRGYSSDVIKRKLYKKHIIEITSSDLDKILNRMVNEKLITKKDDDQFYLYKRREIKKLDPKTEKKPKASKEKIVYGRQTIIENPTEKINSDYAIMELDDILPSNDPHTFSKNKNYPESCQVRDYSANKSEQLKVINNATNFKAEFLLTNTPAATDGPPILLKEGFVLGGNSRMMSLKRLAAKGEFDKKYKNELIKSLPIYDIKPSQISDMKQPVLVRLVNVNIQKCDHYSKLFNDSLMQQQSDQDEGFTAARRLRASGKLNQIAEIFNEAGDVTFIQALEDRQIREKILDVLKREGILHSQNSTLYLDEDGELTISGRDRIQAMLLGAILKDKILINKAKQYANIIIKIIPQVMAMENLPGEWNLMNTIHEVIRKEYERKQQRVPRETFVNQVGFDQPEIPKLVQLVWLAFDELKLAGIKSLMTNYVKSARNATDPNAMFASGDEKPIEVFKKLLNIELDKINNKGKLGLRDDLVGMDGIGEIETVEMFPDSKPQKTKKKKIDYDYSDGNYQVTCKNDKCGIPFDNTKIDDPDKLFHIISTKILPKLDLAQEHFIVIYLNQAHNVLGYKIVNKGSINQSVVDAKAIMRAALLLGPVQSLALCHNHPSGNLAASEADIVITRKLKDLMSLFDFSFMDHIIIAGNKYTSLREKGLAGLSGLSDGYELQEEKLILADQNTPEPIIDKMQNENDSSEDKRNGEDGNNSKLLTIDDMKNLKATELPITGITKQIMDRLTVPFMILIWGKQGSMKSSLAMIMGADFSNHGKVLFHTNEENISDARIKDRFNRLGLYAKNMYFNDSGQFSDIVDLLNGDPEIKFVIIDSLNFLDTPQKEIIQLKNEFPDVSLVIIAHSEKMGRHYKGEGLVAFKADTEIKLENGTATVLKHRDAFVGDREVSIRQSTRPRRYRKRKIDPLYEAKLRATGQLREKNVYSL